MSKKAADGIMQGLREAISFSRGETTAKVFQDGETFTGRMTENGIVRADETKGSMD